HLEREAGGVPRVDVLVRGVVAHDRTPGQGRVGPQRGGRVAGGRVRREAARAVDLAENDGVGGAVGERPGDGPGPLDTVVGAAAVGVAEDQVVGAVAANGEAVGAAVGGQAQAAAGRGRVGGTEEGLDLHHVLPAAVTARWHVAPRLRLVQ